MKISTDIKAPAVTFWSLLGLFALAHWAIFTLFPRISDDYWYGILQADYLRGVSDSISWDAFWETMRVHLTSDNTRLANVVFMFLQLLPVWVSALVPAGCVLWLSWGICRFARIDGRNLLLVTIALLAVTIFPPWFENFFTLCFALNYLPPAAMMCAYIISLTDDGPRSRWSYVNALVLGVWHEAFGISLVVGSLAYIIATPHRRHAVRLALWIVPGTIFLCITAVLTAINNCGYVISDYNPIHNLVAVGKLQVSFFIFIICVICRAVHLRDWRALLSPWIIMLLMVALTSIGINTVITRGERISTVAHIASILGIMRCLAETLPRRWRTDTAPSLTIAAIITALLCWHYAAVIHRSWQYCKVWHDMEARGAMSPGAVFVELPPPVRNNLICWRKPDACLFDVWNVWHYSEYIGMNSDDRSHRWIIPAALKSVTPTSGTPIPGNAGIRSVDGWLYMPDDADHAYLPIFTTRLGPFVKDQVCQTYPFTADDGRRYILIAPIDQYFPTFLFPIKSMDFRFDGPYTTSIDQPPFTDEHGNIMHIF
ncbi:MAG: hypothetical protein K1V76_09380 [Candidatus Amulumruptor sp.]